MTNPSSTPIIAGATPDISALRLEIDRLDREILAIIQRRTAVARMSGTSECPPEAPSWYTLVRWLCLGASETLVPRAGSLRCCCSVLAAAVSDTDLG